MTLGEKIKQIRLYRDLTQKELGAKIGVSDAKIRHYELGLTKNPKRSTIEAIASALGVGITVLTDLDITTLGDVKSILLQLDEKVGIQLKGELLENGKLKSGTISIAFDDDMINEFLKEWADRLYYINKNYDPYTKKIANYQPIYDYEVQTCCDIYCDLSVEKKSGVLAREMKTLEELGLEDLLKK